MAVAGEGQCSREWRRRKGSPGRGSDEAERRTGRGGRQSDKEEGAVAAAVKQAEAATAGNRGRRLEKEKLWGRKTREKLKGIHSNLGQGNYKLTSFICCHAYVSSSTVLPRGTPRLGIGSIIELGDYACEQNESCSSCKDSLPQCFTGNLLVIP
nr:hypothetical protein Iba_chr14dCG7030 [Ipomoea batatas]GME20609.1 hypothetical protein Iba_scaffold25600CG0040 [Ipomoea batatas]